MAAITKSAALKAKRGNKAKPEKLSARKPSVSPLHRAVIDAYFSNGCTSKRRAMAEAGYADSTARVASQKVFGRPDVIAEIERRQKLQARASDTSEERILAELAKIAFSNLGDLIEVNADGSAWLDMTQMTADHKAALSEFNSEIAVMPSRGEDEPENRVLKTRIKFHSKQAALDSLARIRGLFRDKVEISGTQSLVERIAAARLRTNQAMKDRI